MITARDIERRLWLDAMMVESHPEGGYVASLDLGNAVPLRCRASTPEDACETLARLVRDLPVVPRAALAQITQSCQAPIQLVRLEHNGDVALVNPEHVTSVRAVKNARGDIHWVRMHFVDGSAFELEVEELPHKATREYCAANPTHTGPVYASGIELFDRVCKLLGFEP